MKALIFFILFPFICLGQFKPTIQCKKIKIDRYLFMTTPTIGVELPTEKKNFALKTTSYKADPTIVNILPYQKKGFLSRVKLTTKIGVNASSHFNEIAETDALALVKYNYRLKIKLNHVWAIIFNVATVGIDGFNKGSNYSIGFHLKV